MIVVIDTNILLDHLQQRQPYDAVAARVWKLAEQGGVESYVSAICFNNVFYIARKQVGNAKALEIVKLIRQVFRLIPLDEADVTAAAAQFAIGSEWSVLAVGGKRRVG